MNKLRLTFIFTAAAVSVSVQAYKESTHEELSARAVINSDLGASSGLLKSLGLKSLDQEFQNSDYASQKIINIVRFGARHEDTDGRPTRHFYDPMSGEGIYAYENSLNWILYGVSQSSDEEFSYRKAREQFLLALTAMTPPARARAWGLTFQNLGHVIHHIQDMAQPQHVRGDAHLDASEFAQFLENWPYPFRDPSYYEAYTETNPTQWTPYLGQAGLPVVLRAARQFWSSGNPETGVGLADFTNRNFVSKDTNFTSQNGQPGHAEDYPLPVPTRRITWPLNASELGIQNADALCAKLMNDPNAHRYPVENCEIDLIESVVVDQYTGLSEVNTRASSFSAFDQYLKDVGDRRGLFTLNSLNFNAGYRFLIPKAVSYSAGLINYFFRGRLESLDVTVESDKVRVTIRKISTLGDQFGPGEFKLYYDSSDGTRKPLTLMSGAEVEYSLFAPNDEHVLEFTAPEDLDLVAGSISADHRPFVLVYDGIVGQERAIAGLLFDVPDLVHGFVFNTVSELQGNHPLPGLLYKKGGEWRLYPQGGVPLLGNVDWKGWYVNDKPSRLLTWDSSWIYKDGKVFAVAPHPVLGAALQRNPNGIPWLIVICVGESKDIVFRRPAVRSQSTEGWERVAEFNNPVDLENIHGVWRFNGDGTEAQTMRIKRPPDSSNNQHAPRMYSRLMITVTGATANFNDLGNTQIIKHSIKNHDYECSESHVNTYDLTTLAGETIIAVNYVDSQAVFAKMKVSSAKTRIENGTLDDNIIKSLLIHEQNETHWKLQVAANEYDWITESGFYDVNLGERELHVNLNRNSSYGALSRLDVRSGVLLLEHQVSEINAQSSAVPGYIDGQPVHESEAIIDGTTYVKYSVNVQGTAIAEFNDLNLSTLHEEPDANFLDMLAGIENFTDNCIDDEETNTQNESENFTEEMPPQIIHGALPQYPWHPLSSSASYATDLDGNSFISVRIDERTGENSVLNRRYYNYLTGGDPIAITAPVTGDSTFFDSIGVR